MTDLQARAQAAAEAPVLHISFARKDREEATGEWCYTCSTHTQVYSWFQEWYGWHSTCCSCGDSWTEEGLDERPFARGWRQKAATKAKANFDRVHAAIAKLGEG